MKAKKILILLSAFIVAGILISYWYLSYSSYNQAIGNNPIEVKSQDNSIEISSNIIKNEQNESATNVVTQTTEVTTQTTNTNVNAVNENTQPAAQPKSENQPIKEVKPDPVKQEELKNLIVTKYQSSFLSLKNESIGALNSLLSQAKAELNSIPQDKKASSTLSLGVKYLNLGRALESECDSKFYALLSQMEQELKSSGLTTEAVDAAKNQYSTEKSARRKLLMSKAF